MRAWALRRQYSEPSEADPEYSSDAQRTRELEAGLVSVVRLSLEIRSPRAHVLQSLTDTCQPR